MRTLTAGNGNGNELKIAVLAEQLRAVADGLAAHRTDNKEFRDGLLKTFMEFRDDLRKGFADLKTEVISRADRHEEQDRQYHAALDGRMDRHDRDDSTNFKNIDDRMVAADKATIARESAREAVNKYKKTQWTLIGTALATIFWNLFRALEPFLHKVLSGGQ